MIDCDAEVIVAGSGFAGSLTALIIDRLGLPVVLIDQTTHPRFAIGESSTPIAGMLLRDLARKYDLPRIAPLAKYGNWRATYPEVACGLKRGFSYFQQHAHQPFRPTADHANELLVTASANDDVGDTHWYRADVDRFFIGEVTAAGIPFYDATRIVNVTQDAGGRWLLNGERNGEPVRIRAGFFIDASGGGGLLKGHLRLPDERTRLKTRSRAIYGHFRGVSLWHDRFAACGGRVSDHPFDCDAAALHHLLDGAWMWQLRFDNGVTSVGLVLDESRFPRDETIPVETEWAAWLKNYPDLCEQLHSAELVAPGDGLVRTGRLQRLVSKTAGHNYALLPHSAGFVDPLHSTGIAHSLCAVEHLTAIFGQHIRQGKLIGSERLSAALEDYSRRLHDEFMLIDRLVSGCYKTLGRFRLFTAFSMLYFAAATTYEQRRADHSGSCKTAFLCADDEELQRSVHDASDRLDELLSVGNVSDEVITRFEQTVAAAVRPFNHVGLCDPAAQNMYRYTAASVG